MILHKTCKVELWYHLLQIHREPHGCDLEDQQGGALQGGTRWYLSDSWDSLQEQRWEGVSSYRETSSRSSSTIQHWWYLPWGHSVWPAKVKKAGVHTLSLPFHWQFVTLSGVGHLRDWAGHYNFDLVLLRFKRLKDPHYNNKVKKFYNGG